MHEHKCLRCGWKWESKLERPASCPMCKQYKWDKPTQEKEVD